MKEEITFTAHGIVLGNYWGGGKGAYSATEFSGKTKKEIMTKANDALKNGSLDSGMGFESLIGARLVVTQIRRIFVDNAWFKNEEHEVEFIGKLKDEEADFLEECGMYM